MKLGFIPSFVLRWHVELGSSGRGYRYGAMAADTGGPSVTYDICLCGLSFPLGTPCNSGPWADGAISSHQAGPLTPCGPSSPAPKAQGSSSRAGRPNTPYPSSPSQVALKWLQEREVSLAPETSIEVVAPAHTSPAPLPPFPPRLLPRLDYSTQAAPRRSRCASPPRGTSWFGPVSSSSSSPSSSPPPPDCVCVCVCELRRCCSSCSCCCCCCCQPSPTERRRLPPPPPLLLLLLLPPPSPPLSLCEEGRFQFAVTFLPPRRQHHWLPRGATQLLSQPELSSSNSSETSGRRRVLRLPSSPPPQLARSSSPPRLASFSPVMEISPKSI
ncbi:leucine-rich repeat extensin-like protein 5 isoform X2 [Hippoglossus hippoglossus]|uniref:leucine-rich repeat extensin-like protein 5 isoform X2 n=1 Tax=Hippoglossus hippoglossus TaxID=8267 RepID=UPI00148DB2BA|nr:leucine-rich repeat extensin-like protein 5 isoform X2 [Hippoglossus hippoglossus]